MLTFSSTPSSARARFDTRAKLLKAKLDAARDAYAAHLRSMPVVEDGRQYRRDRLIKEIILALETLGTLMPCDLAHNFRVSRPTVHRALRVAMERGLIVPKGFGLYGLPEGHVSVSEAEGLKAFNAKVLQGAAYPEKPTQRPRNAKKLPGRPKYE